MDLSENSKILMKALMLRGTDIDDKCGMLFNISKREVRRCHPIAN